LKYAIEGKNLTKSYGDFLVIDKLKIKVPQGKVYGFLGRNGSGKTTTIRMIMGLIKPDSGNVEIFGKKVNRDNTDYLRDIGAIIETPGFYNNLSAYENLEISCELFGVEKNVIAESLDTVGLSDIDNRSVGKFSLGMKQRLGIASALIHFPKILILDEPTNGLDPMGIIEMRKLIKNLSKTMGITILVSSHLLNEIQLIADYIGIIDNGKLITEGDMNLLDINDQNYLILETNNFKKAENILNKLNFKFSKENNNLKIYCDYEDNSIINENLVYGGLKVYNLKSHLKTLEERFLGITAD
jgi:ABC-type multidrug transport system ATPase subunit